MTDRHYTIYLRLLPGLPPHNLQHPVFPTTPPFPQWHLPPFPHPPPSLDTINLTPNLEDFKTTKNILQDVPHRVILIPPTTWYIPTQPDTYPPHHSPTQFHPVTHPPIPEDNLPHFCYPDQPQYLHLLPPLEQEDNPCSNYPTDPTLRQSMPYHRGYMAHKSIPHQQDSKTHTFLYSPCDIDHTGERPPPQWLIAAQASISQPTHTTPKVTEPMLVNQFTYICHPDTLTPEGHPQFTILKQPWQPLSHSEPAKHSYRTPPHPRSTLSDHHSTLQSAY